MGSIVFRESVDIPSSVVYYWHSYKPVSYTHLALIREHFNPQSYFLEPRSIVIYYQQYDIAPYATGIPEFRLPYPENITSCI